MRRKPGTSIQLKATEKTTPVSRAKEEQDFLVLLCYLRKSPKIVQQVFSPYVKALADYYITNSTVGSLIERLRTTSKSSKKVDRQHDLLFQNFAVLTNLYELTTKMASIRKQIFSGEGQPEGENTSSYDCAPYPINLVRPKYYLTEIIAKQQAEIDLGVRTQNLTDNTSLLYAEPRFYEKLNELVHFKNNKKFKGAILMLEYQGHAITGGRTYAVLNKGTVEIWQMSSHIFPFPFAQPSQNDDFDDNNMSIKSGHIDEPTFSRQYKFVAHTDKVTCASFSSDQFYLLTGGVDRKVRLWCLRLKILLAEYRNHTKTIWDVHFNPSGYYFLSGSADGLMILWRTDTAFSQRIFDHGSDIYKVSFAKHPNYAISAGEDCKIKIWHIVEAQIKYCLQLDNPIINFTLGHSGIFIVAIESDGRVTVFNLLQGVMINTFYFYSKKVRQSSESKVIIHDACLSEDERELTCITNQHILLYSMDVLQSRRKINVYEKSSRIAGSERKVTPKEIIMISNKMSLNFCGYRDYRLLVVGAATRGTS